MTVFENIAFPLVEHTKKPFLEVTKDVSALAAMVGLSRLALSKFPSELSGGMRKRVGLARAIALKPKILLYDEPTTGLDPIMTDVVNHLITDTQKQLHITSVVISHDIQSSFEIGDKIAMLQNGKIVLEGDAGEFQKTQNTVVKNFLSGKACQEEYTDTSV
ncbi:MAG TPA: ATP-binding cassette domain-containing protein, partial [bacterium]|nr:ATP-binding cassette domain-containing protein [bacterium]